MRKLKSNLIYTAQVKRRHNSEQGPAGTKIREAPPHLHTVVGAMSSERVKESLHIGNW